MSNQPDKPIIYSRYGTSWDNDRASYVLQQVYNAYDSGKMVLLPSGHGQTKQWQRVGPDSPDLYATVPLGAILHFCCQLDSPITELSEEGHAAYVLAGWAVYHTAPAPPQEFLDRFPLPPYNKPPVNQLIAWSGGVCKEYGVDKALKEILPTLWNASKAARSLTLN